MNYNIIVREKLIKIDTYYPSSQVCSICGNIKKELKDLRIRRFVCEECKNDMDRDINASINILMEEIKSTVATIGNWSFEGRFIL